MTPIFFTVGGHLPVMVIPNTDAHVDGHPVLTYTYNVYRDNGFEDPATVRIKERELLLEKKTGPDYLGSIAFEDPGKLFNTADGSNELSSDEVQEIIENISHYRDHPGMWQMGEGEL